MAIKQIFITGTSQQVMELPPEYWSQLPVMNKAKDDLSKLLDKHTPQNEISEIVVLHNGTIKVIYSKHCNKNAFKQEAFQNYCILHEALTKKTIKL